MVDLIITAPNAAYSLWDYMHVNEYGDVVNLLEEYKGEKEPSLKSLIDGMRGERTRLPTGRRDLIESDPRTAGTPLVAPAREDPSAPVETEDSG